MLRLLILLTCVAGGNSFKIKRERTCGEEAGASLIYYNPWLVYLEYWRDDTRINIRCAATLVDSRYLITAAHCIRTPKFSRLVARFGEYDLTREEDCVGGVCADPVVRIEVEEAFVHPEYDGKSHDIAVLRLKEDTPYTDFIRPICLPSGQLDNDAVFAASGWGEIPYKGYYSSVKKIILLPFWDRQACEKSYKKRRLPTNIICAGGEEGIDTCRGDSGGPLVLVKDRIELWGVTSAGNSRCGTKNSPGFYTNVADHLEWIETIIYGTSDQSHS